MQHMKLIATMAMLASITSVSANWSNTSYDDGSSYNGANMSAGEYNQPDPSWRQGADGKYYVNDGGYDGSMQGQPMQGQMQGQPMQGQRPQGQWNQGQQRPNQGQWNNNRQGCQQPGCQSCRGGGGQGQQGQQGNANAIQGKVRQVVVQDASGRNVQVNTDGKGNVTLTGTVDSDDAKSRIEAAVKKIDGVKSVTNNITVRGQ